MYNPILGEIKENIVRVKFSYSGLAGSRTSK